MAKGKTKKHKQAGKKKARKRMFKAIARKALPAKHRLHKLAAKRKAEQKSKTKKPARTGVAPGLERFDHTKPLPKVAIPSHITQDIIDKKDLLIAPDFANHLILRYIRKNPKLGEEMHKPHFTRSKDYEAMKKWVRQELRVLVGMFVLEPNLKKLLHEPTATILNSHKSTKERLPYYTDLYEQLFDGKKPEVILDVCAGINPCSYEYLGCTPVYYAVDVSPQLMDFVQAWFNEKGIVGKAWSGDITDMTEFPDADTVFIFKGMDVLERVKYGFGEDLLSAFKNRRVVVSFATQTMGGNREISTSKRNWVERWAEEHGKSVRILDIPNERFYVVE